MKKTLLVLLALLVSTTPLNAKQNTNTLATPSLLNSQFWRTIQNHEPPSYTHLPRQRFEICRNKNQLQPIWFQMQSLVSVLLGNPDEPSKKMTGTELVTKTKERLLKSNIPIDETFIEDTIIPFLTNKLIAYERETQSYRLNVDPLTAAIWAEDIKYIKTVFIKAISISSLPTNPLGSLLEKFSSITKTQPLYPIETRYPVLKAISLLDVQYQRQLIDFIEHNPILQREPIVDSIILMLKKEPAPNWLRTHAPNIRGRIYEVTVEGQNLKGGLGRVEQYHTLGMKQLGADPFFVEPYYRYKLSPDHETIPLDYTNPQSIAMPLKEIHRYCSFPISIDGQTIIVDVYRGINKNGIPVFLISDIGNKYVRTMYEYNPDETKQNPDPTMLKFSEFFTKAAWEFIKIEESKICPNHTGPTPIINLNDAQSLLLSVWRSLDKVQYPLDPLLQRFFISGTTHTYRNRGFLGEYSTERRRLMLNAMGIPEEYHGLFLNKEENAIDMTLAGLRCSDYVKGVSAIHAFEAGKYDESLTHYGITNGDDLELSSKEFRDIMLELRITKKYFDYNLTPQELIAIKRKAKENLNLKLGLNLDPSKIVISYSGRLVDEKAGRKRAFTEENIKELCKQGAQLIIFGNVQLKDHYSLKIADDFARIQQEISSHPEIYPGKFIFKTPFTLQEQIMLLAATDIQVQDSDRRTGASEYTESDVSANGGLQFSPPFWEGIIAKQGVPVNFAELTGNTIIPPDSNPLSYLNTFRFCIDFYNHRRERFAQLQLNSLKLSQALNCQLTAAEYLRQWNAHIEERSILQTNTKISFSVTPINSHEYKITIRGKGTLNTPFIHWGYTPDWQPIRSDEQMNPVDDEKFQEGTLRVPQTCPGIKFIIGYLSGHTHEPSYDNNNKKDYQINLQERLTLPTHVFHEIARASGIITDLPKSAMYDSQQHFNETLSVQACIDVQNPNPERITPDIKFKIVTDGYMPEIAMNADNTIFIWGNFYEKIKDITPAEIASLSNFGGISAEEILKATISLLAREEFAEIQKNLRKIPLTPETLRDRVEEELKAFLFAIQGMSSREIEATTIGLSFWFKHLEELAPINGWDPNIIKALKERITFLKSTQALIEEKDLPTIPEALDVPITDLERTIIEKARAALTIGYSA